MLPAALLLLLPQSPPPTIAIPEARLALAWPLPLIPRVNSEELRLQDRAIYGGHLHTVWQSSTSFAACTIRHIRPNAQDPLKLTPAQLAENFYNQSKELAETLAKVSSTSSQARETLAKKFTNRQITNQKIGPYSAVLDTHEDLLTGQLRRFIAFGDQNEQWLIEFSLEKNDAEIAALLEPLTNSIQIKTLNEQELRQLPHLAQSVPGLPITLKAPVPFTAYQRQPVTGTTKPGIAASLRPSTGLTVDVYLDHINPRAIRNIDTTIASFRDGYNVDEFESVRSEITPYKLGPFTGQRLEVAYRRFGNPAYAIHLAAITKDQRLLIHIIAETPEAEKTAKDLAATLALHPTTD